LGRRSVLAVSAGFPPWRGVGAVRPFKFVKYLPEYGWDPIVLAMRGGGDEFGMSLLEQLDPTTRVYRTAAVVPSQRLVAKMGSHALGPRVRLWQRILRGLRTALLIPDDFIGWLPFALARGLQILRRERVDVVFSTSPPATAHIVAYLLSWWAGLPLVVDFRDPWTQHPLHHWLQNPMRLRIEELLERRVLQRAARAIGVSQPRTAAMAAKYPDIPFERFLTITNGFDRADYGPPAAVPTGERFAVVYTGSFSYWRQDTFLDALEAALRESTDLGADLEVVFAGEGSEGLARQVRARRLEGTVHVLGLVPYERSIALQKGADVLLLFLGPGGLLSTCYPAKVFEYIATGRPILALTTGGITGDLVLEAGTGRVVAPDDASSIKQALLGLYSEWRTDSLPTLRDPSFPERFERRALTERLARIFDQAAV
jgi:glycosyltransferase involved in cell wall biosynthesis